MDGPGSRHDGVAMHFGVKRDETMAVCLHRGPGDGRGRVGGGRGSGPMSPPTFPCVPGPIAATRASPCCRKAPKCRCRAVWMTGAGAMSSPARTAAGSRVPIWNRSTTLNRSTCPAMGHVSVSRSSVSCSPATGMRTIGIVPGIGSAIITVQRHRAIVRHVRRDVPRHRFIAVQGAPHRRTAHRHSIRRPRMVMRMQARAGRHQGPMPHPPPGPVSRMDTHRSRMPIPMPGRGMHRHVMTRLRMHRGMIKRMVMTPAVTGMATEGPFTTSTAPCVHGSQAFAANAAVGAR